MGATKQTKKKKTNNKVVEEVQAQQEEIEPVLSSDEAKELEDDDNTTGPDVDDDDDDDIAVNEYVVEAIIDKRYNPNLKESEYFLRWKGYSDSDNTWEPESNLDCPELIKAFNEEYDAKNKNKPKSASKKKSTPSTTKQPSTSIAGGSTKKRGRKANTARNLAPDFEEKSNQTENKAEVVNISDSSSDIQELNIQDDLALDDDEDFFDLNHKGTSTRTRRSTNTRSSVKITPRRSVNFADISISNKPSSQTATSDHEEEITSVDDRDILDEIMANSSGQTKDTDIDVMKTPPKKKKSLVGLSKSVPTTNKSTKTGSARKLTKVGIGGDDSNYEPERIIGATELDAQLMFLIKWKNMNKADLITADIARIACPQLVISFFEERVAWNHSEEYEGIKTFGMEGVEMLKANDLLG